MKDHSLSSSQPYQQQLINTQPQWYSFRVGNITSQGVTLVDNDYHIIQLPYSILPAGSRSGSIIKLSIMRDVEQQKRQQQRLERLIQTLQLGENNIVMEGSQEGESSNIIKDKKDTNNENSKPKIIQQKATVDPSKDQQIQIQDQQDLEQSQTIQQQQQQQQIKKQPIKTVSEAMSTGMKKKNKQHQIVEAEE